MPDNEICFLTAVQMAEAVRKKRLSPVEITEAFLRRIEQINPSFNAYCTVAAESAFKQAQEAEDMVMRKARLGVLHGVPVAVKDFVFTKGIRTTAGSKIYEDFIPSQDAVIVERLKAAGAIIIGKTNTSEFGWIALTYNRLFGETHNPWNKEYVSGGSSGGSAAAVALRLAPIATGSDIGGSIRVPGSFCGVLGLKTTFGLVPQYPDFPGGETYLTGWGHMCSAGPITNTVADAALALQVMAGRDDRDPRSLPVTGQRYLPLPEGNLKGLRIAWSRDLGFVTIDPQVGDVAEAAAKVLSSLGATVEEAHPGVIFPEADFSTVIGVRLAAALQNHMVKYRDVMDPVLVRFLDRMKDKLAVDYDRSCLKLLECQDAIRPFFDKYDLLLTPSVALPPFKSGMLNPREIDGKKVSPLGWTAFCCLMNISGLPAASVPAGWTQDGLPIGIQIAGRRLEENTVLRAAAAFEKSVPWQSKRLTVD
ncbi:MAG: amidase [Dehalococcoidales bacterium]|nr:amidase [Dehalococcoidales bacterium]